MKRSIRPRPARRTPHHCAVIIFTVLCLYIALPRSAWHSSLRTFGTGGLAVCPTNLGHCASGRIHRASVPRRRLFCRNPTLTPALCCLCSVQQPGGAKRRNAARWPRLTSRRQRGDTCMYRGRRTVADGRQPPLVLVLRRRPPAQPRFTPRQPRSVGTTTLVRAHGTVASPGDGPCRFVTALGHAGTVATVKCPFRSLGLGRLDSDLGWLSSRLGAGWACRATAARLGSVRSVSSYAPSLAGPRDGPTEEPARSADIMPQAHPSRPSTHTAPAILAHREQGTGLSLIESEGRIPRALANLPALTRRAVARRATRIPFAAQRRASSLRHSNADPLCDAAPRIPFVEQ